MKSFRFSLESVHNLREARRREAERRLGRAAAGILAELAALEELMRARDAIEAKLAGLTGSLNAAEMAMQVDYLALLVERETRARRRLAELECERDELRQAAAMATREAKVTGQLRATQEARHRAEAARAEQNQLDEIAVIANLRRERGENG